MANEFMLAFELIPNLTDVFFFFFLSFSCRYPQKDSPLNKMSAFSIRKQSPNQSGNTESPSFSLWALKSLKHSLPASLFASMAMPIAQLPFQGTPPLFGRGHASYGIHGQTHVSCKASSVVCKLLLAAIQANHHAGQQARQRGSIWWFLVGALWKLQGSMAAGRVMGRQ